MIRISVTPTAFDAITATLPVALVHGGTGGKVS